IDSHTPSQLPSTDAPLPCPADGRSRIANVTLEAGHYLCDSPGVLWFSARIEVKGPVVIEVGPRTRFVISGAQIGAAGGADDFVVSQPSTIGVARYAVIHNSVFHGRILAPRTYLYTVGDVTWRGTFEVSWWLVWSRAVIDGAWEGTTPSTATSYTITGWALG
ncbi:MAG: hypothetical protein ACE5GB_14410, partial [Acidimicrobiales bacterium]